MDLAARLAAAADSFSDPTDSQREAMAEERRRAFEAEEQDHLEEPDEPAEEDGTMAKDVEKHCGRCGKKLRSDNTRGVCGIAARRPPAPRRVA